MSLVKKKLISTKKSLHEWFSTYLGMHLQSPDIILICVL
jgi:hypothetical protein